MARHVLVETSDDCEICTLIQDVVKNQCDISKAFVEGYLCGERAVSHGEHANLQFCLAHSVVLARAIKEYIGGGIATPRRLQRTKVAHQLQLVMSTDK